MASGNSTKCYELMNSGTMRYDIVFSARPFLGEILQNTFFFFIKLFSFFCMYFLLITWSSDLIRLANLQDQQIPTCPERDVLPAYSSWRSCVQGRTWKTKNETGYFLSLVEGKKYGNKAMNQAQKGQVTYIQFLKKCMVL